MYGYWLGQYIESYAITKKSLQSLHELDIKVIAH
jgi:hypothetical protein